MNSIRKFFLSGLVVLSCGNSFSQGTGININTSYYEFAPALSADGKTMVFQSNREGGYKLYESIMQPDGNWSEPRAINEVSPPDKNFVLIGGPSLTFDGSTLFFCALLQGGLGDMDIYYTTKTGKTWSAPQNVGAPVSTDKFDGFPSVSADGKKLFFTRTDGSTDCHKILVSEKTDMGWKEPKELPSEINASCAKAPRILSDGRTLVFSSDKNSGKGGYDLYRSVQNKNGKWGDAVPVEAVNSAESEAFGAITELQELMYYVSKGDIYSAGVPPRYILNKIALTLVDAESKKPVNAKVNIKDAGLTEVVKGDTNNTNGKYQAILVPGKKYNFEITTDGYDDSILAMGFLPGEDFSRIDQTIELKPRKREVLLDIADLYTNEGLSVEIKITNLETGEETIIHETVGRDGKYAVNLREGNKYNVEVTSKEGYAYSTMKIDVPKSKPTSKTLPKPDTATGSTNTVAVIEPDVAPIKHQIKVMPLKQGAKLVLKDIFFEFNADQLKDSSYIELNRVVDLMNENPNIHISINAHTDDVGSNDFNMKLSERRAKNIEAYLVSKGVDSKRLKPIGFGKSKPVASNATEEGRAKNRRVELKVIEIVK